MPKQAPGKIICKYVGYKSINQLLLVAAEAGNVRLATIALEAGADINVKPERGFDETALMEAARNNDVSMVKLLIDNKADVTIKNRDGLSAAGVTTSLWLKGFITNPDKRELLKPQDETLTNDTQDESSFPFD